jgi:hypothetical protein
MSGSADLRVDPTAIAAYSKAVNDLGLNSTGALAAPMAQLATAAQAAFGATDDAMAGVFAEGANMVAVINQQAAAFAAFQQDAGRGLVAIACAAQACANAYSVGDAESAEQIGLAKYAFGESTQRPPGVPAEAAKTLDQLAAEQPGGTTGTPMAEADVKGTEGTVTGVDRMPGNEGTVTTYTYSDGSTRAVTSMSGYGGSYSAVVITGADKTEISRSARWTEYTASGAPVSVQERGHQGKPGHVVVKVTEQPDGSETVETTITSVDATGKPVDTTTSTTVGATSGDTDRDRDRGPMGQAIDTYGRETAAKAGVTTP